MKIRTGFVSNSSSSSFIINLGEDTLDNLEDHISDCTEDDISEISYVLNDLTLSEKNRIWCYDEYGYFSGNSESIKKQVNDDYYSMNNEDFYNKYKNEIDEYWKDFPETDNCYIGDFEDHGGVEMEVHNGDIWFMNCKAEMTISNH